MIPSTLFQTPFGVDMKFWFSIIQPLCMVRFTGYQSQKGLHNHPAQCLHFPLKRMRPRPSHTAGQSLSQMYDPGRFSLLSVLYLLVYFMCMFGFPSQMICCQEQSSVFFIQRFFCTSVFRVGSLECLRASLLEANACGIRLCLMLF